MTNHNLKIKNLIRLGAVKKKEEKSRNIIDIKKNRNKNKIRMKN